MPFCEQVPYKPMSKRYATTEWSRSEVGNDAIYNGTSEHLSTSSLCPTQHKIDMRYIEVRQRVHRLAKREDNHGGMDLPLDVILGDIDLPYNYPVLCQERSGGFATLVLSPGGAKAFRVSPGTEVPAPGQGDFFLVPGPGRVDEFAQEKMECDSNITVNTDDVSVVSRGYKRGADGGTRSGPARVEVAASIVDVFTASENGSRHTRGSIEVLEHESGIQLMMDNSLFPTFQLQRPGILVQVPFNGSVYYASLQPSNSIGQALTSVIDSAHASGMYTDDDTPLFWLNPSLGEAYAAMIGYESAGEDGGVVRSHLATAVYASQLHDITVPLMSTIPVKLEAILKYEREHPFLGLCLKLPDDYDPDVAPGIIERNVQAAPSMEPRLDQWRSQREQWLRYLDARAADPEQTAVVSVRLYQRARRAVNCPGCLNLRAYHGHKHPMSPVWVTRAPVNNSEEANDVAFASEPTCAFMVSQFDLVHPKSATNIVEVQLPSHINQPVPCLP